MLCVSVRLNVCICMLEYCIHGYILCDCPLFFYLHLLNARCVFDCIMKMQNSLKLSNCNQWVTMRMFTVNPFNTLYVVITVLSLFKRSGPWSQWLPMLCNKQNKSHSL